ncbi:basic amino acid ABC transporter substrate-binding protein [Halonatronum saccharophilum]|uniref:basic amino acid ABC transporter substrate-binding protein n=1 Tax=Halonatronum saccharophilum TaxID=150060 RepID=UPI000483C887|nr:basic amino acid ABC transporter substrate-binding protein [Halonatronum saccharophilum]
MKKLVFLSLLMFAVLVVGCSNQEGTTWENVQENGLRVGMDAAYRPFEFYDEDGEITGFDADLIREIGDRLDVDIVLQDVSFDGIIPGLQAGEYDLIISAMTITEERAQAVNFSDPYFNAGQVIAVLEDNDTINNEGDLKGKRVGVQLGTTADLLVSEMDGIDIVRYDTIPEAFIDLDNERVEAVVNDLPVTAAYIQERGRAKIVGEPFTEEFYGMAMRQGDEDLLENINEALAQIKDDGTYDQIFAKWFK